MTMFQQVKPKSPREIANKIVKNVHNILNDLEESLSQSNQYEREIFNGKYCCIKRSGSNGVVDNCDNDCRHRSKRVDCHYDDYELLQASYKDLSEKYSALLRNHKSRCDDLADMTDSLTELKKTFQGILIELNRANTVIRCLGTKYYNLKKKSGYSNARRYAKELSELKAKRSILQKKFEESKKWFDGLINDRLSIEGNPLRAQLLLEIKHSNHLQQENTKLRRELKELKSQLYQDD